MHILASAPLRKKFQAPPFAEETIRTFRESERFETDQDPIDLTQSDSQRTLDQSLYNFEYWRSLDEGPEDLMKGEIGRVKVQADQEGEFTEVDFSGDTRDGEMLIHRHRPSINFGGTYAYYHRYQPNDLKVVTVQNVNGNHIAESLEDISYHLEPTEPGSEVLKAVAEPGTYFHRSRDTE